MSIQTTRLIDSKRRIAVLGGGICGLTAAYRLTKLRPDWSVTLLDANDRLGGVVGTTQTDGFLIEKSADNFIANAEIPWARQLCDELGFSDQIIPTNERYRRAVIWLNGKLHPVPDGFQLMKTSDLTRIFQSRLLTWRGKLRLAGEKFVATKPAGVDGDPNCIADESLASFAIRRLGQEAFERLVQPLVAGIYTADSRKLSMNAALPQFVKMEQTAGSLAAAALRDRQRGPIERHGSGARYNQFWTPRHGMATFVDAIEQQLTNVTIRRSTTVTSVVRSGDQWRLGFSDQSSDSFDGVISCLSATASAKIAADVDPVLASELAAIEHASSSVVCMGYEKSQFRDPLTAFGCVVPAIANRRTIAISFSSMKYPNRAPHGHHLLRVFLGGALQPEYASLPDDETIHLAREEVSTILGVTGDPTFAVVERWANTMPQYHLNHLDRVATIRQRIAALPAFELESNGLDGVGIPQRIRAGNEAASRMANCFAK
ncbi:protoporphyrinogen oxidase [Planctomycetota bacterium]